MEATFYWFTKNQGIVIDQAEEKALLVGEEGTKEYEKVLSEELISGYRWLKEQLSNSLEGNKEWIRLFAHFLHQRPTAPPACQVRQDSILLSNTVEGKGVWKEYYSILMEGKGK